MMSIEAFIVLLSVVLAAIPAVLTLWNHLVFRVPKEGRKSDPPQVSILIPARNEEATIETSIRGALASQDIELEVVVLNDHSEDATAAIVETLANEDPRVRLGQATELPPGWCGKQRACAQLAKMAKYDLMLFIDADVRMQPNAVSDLASYLNDGRWDLVSAFPRQITKTFAEKLLIPLIEYVLLGYLPLAGARRSSAPSFAAGCGQVFLARKHAYEESGGHRKFPTSLHDGLALPRTFREAGRRTDICSGNGLFECRMYEDARSVWSGLLKNAHEGIASPRLIGLFTILLAGGSFLPLVLSSGWLLGGFRDQTTWIWLGFGLSYLPRALNAWRFRQSPLGVVLHPLSILLFLTLQWQAFFRHRRGHLPEWRGRSVGEV